VIARQHTRATVRVPAAEKSDDRVTIPDIMLLLGK
jgi:hypothetical protein